MRHCLGCGKDNTRSTICKKCYTFYVNRLRKQSLVNNLGGCCSRCGYNKTLSALDFHHVNDDKIFGIADSHKNIEQVLQELKKCVLLCSNCHREEHSQKYDVLFLKINEAQQYVKKHKANVIDKITANCKNRCESKPSKEELEKLVWEKPTSHISKEFGVSDKAIEKWCKKYKISKPSRGYWTKLKTGKL